VPLPPIPLECDPSLVYIHETGASGPAVATRDAVDATPEQVSTLVDAGRAATWRMQRALSECPEQS